jgi:hypothetical protein
MKTIWRVVYGSAEVYVDFTDRAEAEAFRDVEGGVIEIYIDGRYNGFY